MKSKYKYLFKNVGLLTISNFGGKILTFLLIPLYTKYLTTSEYGIYDLYTTTVSLLVPVLSVCILDAMLRFSLDENNNKSDIFTIGFRNMIKSVAAFSVLILVNYIFNIFPTLNQYPIYLFLYFASERFYIYFSNVSKGLDKVKEFAVCGFINCAATLFLNILFLTVFHWGIDGYFIANILAFFIAGVYLLFKVKIWKYLKLHLNRQNTKNEMIHYSKHLVFNGLSWWVNNSLDRYIIIWLLGTSENGIYSVAYKIPTVINVVQAIFNQAWTLSAVKEFDDKQDNFYSKTYSTYNLLLVFACSVLIIFDQLIAKLIYSNDFYSAWKYVPFLLISAIFAALNAFLDSIFAASMDSKIIAQTTVIGAVINAVLNLILIHFTGTMGAAIATMISYLTMWAMKHIKVTKIIKLNFSIIKVSVSFALLITQSILYVVINGAVLKHIVSLAILLILAIVNFKDIKSLLLNAKVTLNNIKQKKIEE